MWSLAVFFKSLRFLDRRVALRFDTIFSFTESYFNVYSKLPHVTPQKKQEMDEKPLSRRRDSVREVNLYNITVAEWKLLYA